MKKQNKKQKPTNRKATREKAPVQKERRSFLSIAGTIGVAAAVVGGVGFWGAQTVMASMAERDLTGLGQGTPAIVQVHDVQCAPCIALEKEVRRTLSDFDDEQLDYRIADLGTDAGVLFASRYGASHTTLLLFDGDGELTGRLNGIQDKETLVRTFTSLAEG